MKVEGWPGRLSLVVTENNFAELFIMYMNLLTLNIINMF